MTGENDRPEDTTLPDSVRDHLGHELRTVYTVEKPQPQFLGDDATVPQEFEPQIRRLETRLKTHEEGTEAVEHALDKILDAFGVAPDTVRPSPAAQATSVRSMPDRSGAGLSPKSTPAR